MSEGGPVSATTNSEACTRFLSAVSDLVSGEAGPATVSDAEGHRKACTSCADEFATALAIQKHLASLPEVDPPAEMWGRLQSRLDEIDVRAEESTSPVRRVVPRLVRSPAR